MKKLIFIALLVFPLAVFSQVKWDTYPIDSVTKKVMFTGIVDMPQTPQKTLYQRAKEWFITSYNSGKDVIQLDAPETGKIIGKGFKSFNRLSSNFDYIPSKLWYTVTITARDGKFKYIITDTEIETEGVRMDAQACIAKLDKSASGQRDLMTYSLELKTLDKVVSSIKQAMSKKDDF